MFESMLTHTLEHFIYIFGDDDLTVRGHLADDLSSRDSTRMSTLQVFWFDEIKKQKITIATVLCLVGMDSML